MDIFSIGWYLWIAFFALEEGVALVNKRSGDTLSEHVWSWFNVKPGKPANGWNRARRFGLIAFLAWIAIHFLTGGWA